MKAHSVVAVLVAATLCPVAIARVGTTQSRNKNQGVVGVGVVYPIKERRAQEQLTLDQFNALDLTFSDDSDPKVLSTFYLELLETDGDLPADTSLIIVQQALQDFLTAELDAAYGKNDQVDSVKATIVSQEAITRSAANEIPALASRLETQLSVTFDNEPSPADSKVEATIEGIMQNLDYFLTNLTAWAEGDEELSRVYAATRMEVEDTNGATPPIQADDSTREVEPQGVKKSVLIPVVCAGVALIALLALMAVRRKREEAVTSSPSRKMQQQPLDVQIYMDEDDFSYETSLAESPIKMSSLRTKTVERDYPGTDSDGAFGDNMESPAVHDNGDMESDIFSGIDSQVTSPRGGSRSVFSFLSTSTVPASNVTKKEMSPGAKAGVAGGAAFLATMSPRSNSATPKSRLSSLFAFSEGDEEDSSEDGTAAAAEVPNEESATKPFDEYTPRNGNEVKPFDEFTPTNAVTSNNAAVVVPDSPNNAGAIACGAVAGAAALGAMAAARRSNKKDKNTKDKNEDGALVEVLSSDSAEAGAKTTGKSPDKAKQVEASLGTDFSHLFSDQSSNFDMNESGASSSKANSAILPINLGTSTASAVPVPDTSVVMNRSQSSPGCHLLNCGPTCACATGNDKSAISSEDIKKDLALDENNKQGWDIMVVPAAGKSPKNPSSANSKSVTPMRGNTKSRRAGETYLSDPGPDTPGSRASIDSSRSATQIQLEWSDPRLSAKNAADAKDFVGAANLSVADSDASGAMGRRHAKSTAADGTSKYQSEAMHPLDWSLTSYDGASQSGSDVSRGAGLAADEIQEITTSTKKKQVKRRYKKTPPTTPKAMTPMSAGSQSSFNGSAISALSPRTATSEASTPMSASRQLITDLVWLEKKIANASNNNGGTTPNNNSNSAKSPPRVERIDSMSFASHDGAVSTSGSFDSTIDLASPKKTPRGGGGMQAIVCRDCYAPPGKLKIVIHSTKDGPAVHTVKKGSSLEGHIFPGDLIISVDNVDTRSYTAEQVMKMMTSKTRFERKITVLHFEDTGK